MTLTNEQRAHDLALAILPFIREAIERDGAKDHKPRVFDPYDQYLKAYNSTLSDLNRDLPPTHH